MKQRSAFTPSLQLLPLLVAACGGAVVGDDNPALSAMATSNSLCISQPSSTQTLAGVAPSSVATDATNAYWSNAQSGSIETTLLSGGTILTLATGQVASGGVAVDSSSVYWTSTSEGTVKRVSNQGGSILPSLPGRTCRVRSPSLGETSTG